MSVIASGARYARARRSWASRGLIVVLLWGGAAVLAGCESPAPSKPRPRLSESADGVDPAEALATVLDDLSTILEQNTDPSAAITATRDYLLRRKTDIEAAVRAAEQRSLTLSGEVRTEYLERTDPVLREAMGRFAKAQQRFRATANDAQKVELSEVLNSVR